MKECCRPRRGLNPRPPGLQSDAHPTEPPRPSLARMCLCHCVRGKPNQMYQNGNGVAKLEVSDYTLTLKRPNFEYNNVFRLSLHVYYSLEYVKHPLGVLSVLTWPRGYKMFFMLNSAEHEIFSANKDENDYNR